MRSLISIVFAACIVALLFASSVEAKGGRGGGSGGRGSRGGQQGGPKFSGQQARGSNKQVQQSGPASTDKHSGKLSSKPSKKNQATGAGDATEGSETVNKKQKQLEIAQRQREKRLAQSDHLREIGERNGNENLTANADRMEAQAHELYQQRVDHLSKFGVTDPALDAGSITNPGSLTDSGISDPVGDLAGPELLPASP